MAIPGQLLAPGEPATKSKVKIPVPIKEHITEGEKRIRIEYEAYGFQDKCQPIVDQWKELVKEIVNEVKAKLGSSKGKKREELFFSLVKASVWKRFTVDPSTATSTFPLSASLQPNLRKLDCDNASFLIYDVATSLNIKLSFVTSVDHVVLKGEHFVFDTANGGFMYSVKELPTRLPFHQIVKPEEIQEFTYAPLVAPFLQERNYKKARTYLERALKIRSTSVNTRLNLSRVYNLMGDKETAIKLMNEAIAIAKVPIALLYNERGRLYFEKGDLRSALNDVSKVIELEPMIIPQRINRIGILNLLIQEDPAHASEYKRIMDEDLAVIGKSTPTK